jgi:hypothetical protein
MGQKLCEGASWCLLPAIEGGSACQMHTELPAKKLFNEEGGLVQVEEADKWMTRYRRFKKAEREAAAKQAASDAEIAKRK